jgi:hypothetical protein
MKRARIAGSIVVVATTTILCFQLFAMARSRQSTTTMQSTIVIQQFERADVRIAAYDPSLHPAFAELLSRPEWSHVTAVSVVVTNQSPRAIDGLVPRWIVRAAGGRNESNTIPIDRYIRDDGQPILYPSSQMLVTPTGYITDTQTVGNIVTSSLTSERDVKRWLEPGTQIRLSLDSVIWDDGTVVGPDTFRIIEYLHARHSVAREIASQIQLHQGDRTAIEKVLTAIAAAGKVRSPDDHRAVWTRQFVASSRRNDQWVFRVAALSEPSLLPNK